MNASEIELSSVAALANATARNLAKASISDIELREALHTSKLRDGVRIGKFDILQGEDKGFSIQDARGREIVGGLVYYDTARFIVAELNNGRSHASEYVSRLVRHNGEFRRALDDIFVLDAQLDRSIERGDEFRAAVQEDRLGVLRGRCAYLKQELLTRRRVYL